MIYLDNAATTWPKPESVTAAMTHYLSEVGGSPGRSGHRLALEAGRMVLQARENIAELFNAVDPSRIVFAKNATEALNTALLGLLKPGDRVMLADVRTGEARTIHTEHDDAWVNVHDELKWVDDGRRSVGHQCKALFRKT